VVGRKHGDETHYFRELAGFGLGLVGRTHADLEALVPAVEVPREFDHVSLAGGGASEAHRHVRRLGARGSEANALGARHETAHPFAPLHFFLVAGAVMRALERLLAHGVADGGRIVAEEQRAVSHPVVDVAVAVDVPLVGAVGARLGPTLCMVSKPFSTMSE